MPTSEARIRANIENSKRSTGPRSEAGKIQSRSNSLKHGLTGEGVVLPEGDAAEVERLSEAFGRELGAEGEVGHSLARRMAVMAVRMDRSVEQENAALAERVRRTLDEFEAPEGVDEEEAERLRLEAGQRALFDPSKEACLARKYEAAAERAFFRALKDIRALKKDAARSATSPAAEMAEEARASMARLGSFLPSTPTASGQSSAVAPAASKQPPPPSKSAPSAWSPPPAGHFDVPFAIGRPR